MDQGCDFANQNCEDIILDADSTKTDSDGNQEGSAWIQQMNRQPWDIDFRGDTILNN